MAEERPTPRPLDYLPRGHRRRGPRGVIVALLGVLLMLAGTAVFVGAHSFTETNNLVAEHRRQHELLWAAFGIALLLAGAGIAGVGLKSWCDTDA